MKFKEILKMYEFEETYWWHVGRRCIITAVIRANKLIKRGTKNFRILDVGCGTGMNLQLLEKFTQEVIGLDRNKNALKLCRKRGLHNLILGHAEDMPFSDNEFDLITCFDVLEHIEDDNKALLEIYRITKPGGKILVTVPAFNFLWSSHDETLGHKRRYLYKELKKKTEVAGFKIEKISYAVFFLFLPIFIYRFFKRLLKWIKVRFHIGPEVLEKNFQSSYLRIPKWLNKCFIFILYIESLLLKKINLPFGVSIICLAQKKNSSSSNFTS